MLGIVGFRTILGGYKFHTFDEALADWQSNPRGLTLQQVMTK